MANLQKVKNPGRCVGICQPHFTPIMTLLGRVVHKVDKRREYHKVTPASLCCSEMVLSLKYILSIFQKQTKANAGIVAEWGTVFTSAEPTELGKKQLKGKKPQP